MFGIGPTELIVILVIALLVLGPKRLPELAAGLGKGLAEFRRATADINAELDETRRSLEDQAREAARAAGPEKRVSRSQRVPSPPPAETVATTTGRNDSNRNDSGRDDSGRNDSNSEDTDREDAGAPKTSA